MRRAGLCPRARSNYTHLRGPCGRQSAPPQILHRRGGLVGFCGQSSFEACADYRAEYSPRRRHPLRNVGDCKHPVTFGLPPGLQKRFDLGHPRCHDLALKPFVVRRIFFTRPQRASEKSALPKTVRTRTPDSADPHCAHARRSPSPISTTAGLIDLAASQPDQTTKTRGTPLTHVAVRPFGSPRLSQQRKSGECTRLSSPQALVCGSIAFVDSIVRSPTRVALCWTYLLCRSFNRLYSHNRCLRSIIWHLPSERYV